MPLFSRAAIATNPSLSEDTFIRLCADRKLTDTEVNEIKEQNKQKAEEQEAARLNSPRLPVSDHPDSLPHKIIRKTHEYGGTIGAPVTEGIQKFVTLEVYNPQTDHYHTLNFYNKDELNTFISKLQETLGHFN